LGEKLTQRWKAPFGKRGSGGKQSERLGRGNQRKKNIKQIRSENKPGTSCLGKKRGNRVYCLWAHGKILPYGVNGPWN